MKTKDTESAPEAESQATNIDATSTLSLTQQKILEMEKLKAEQKARRQKQLAQNLANAKNVGKRGKGKLTLLREAVLEKAEHMVLSDWEEVVGTTLELAKRGDTQCLKILWDRVIPSKRAVDPNSSDRNPNVVINISGMQVKSVMDEPVEAEFTEVDEDEG